MDTLPQDFVCLPIIITDYDAILNMKAQTEAPLAEIERSQAVSKKELPEEKQLGISEAVEEIWSRISDAMKTKLREACLEVLRRTDTSPREENDFRYDDDTRFLD